jgi:hypothetical protein
MKKLNYIIFDFNLIFNNSFPNKLSNMFIDNFFGDDWDVFDLLQFAMFDNDF